jgi:hypothetical protein
MPLDFDDEPGDEGAIRTFHIRRSVRGAMEGVLRERDHKGGPCGKQTKERKGRVAVSAGAPQILD